ncbi:protein ARV 2-like [Macadamia integrifolia]|uniref:protein ARV 2-like n=1 Tax=Macadamia integrifolia TaxID=60698 RepID=UPI001C5008A1|nr:protein ARV 2-like [Macadamia integrifolia]XP_042517134.1 protein ARV 2-like [Macadamia integrifolia]
MELRCVHCGFGMKTLFVQYSPGNIRLMKCENCKEVADEYIECEIMILLIDLIWLKRKAYRHLLYNMLDQETIYNEGILWKASFLFLMLDACRALVLNRSQGDRCLSSSSFSSAWVCGKMLMHVFLGNLIFLYVLVFATRVFLRSSSKETRYKDLLLAILVSSYFKIFLLAMMVWEFPSTVIFIIDGFVLSSNAVSLKVMTEATTIRCLGVCFIAHAMKFLTSQMIEVIFSTSLRYFSINC